MIITALLAAGEGQQGAAAAAVQQAAGLAGGVSRGVGEGQPGAEAAGAL